MKFETKHFTIMHDLDEKIISDLSKLIEKKYNHICNFFDFIKKPKEKIKIILCNTFKEYSKHVKKHLSWWRWSQGWGNHNQGVILNLKRISELGNFSKSSYEFINSNYVLNIIGHEIVHVLTTKPFFHSIKDFPAWLNEGLAEYIGGDEKEIKKIKKFLPLLEIAKYSNLSTKEAYVQATNMTLFLVNKYGKKRLVLFLKRYQKIKNFEIVFDEVYKISLKDFEDYFLKEMSITFSSEKI